MRIVKQDLQEIYQGEMESRFVVIIKDIKKSIENNNWLDRLTLLVNMVNYESVCEGRSNAIMSGDIEMEGVDLSLWDKGILKGAGYRTSRYGYDDIDVKYVLNSEIVYIFKSKKGYLLNYYRVVSIADKENRTVERVFCYTCTVELSYIEIKEKIKNIGVFFAMKDNVDMEEYYAGYPLRDPFRDKE